MSKSQTKKREKWKQKHPGMTRTEFARLKRVKRNEKQNEKQNDKKTIA
jgi:hypothetical protein